MEQDNRRSPHDHERHERVRRQPANRRSTPQEQGIKNQHKGASQKAELFTEHAKDKVRMFFGQEGQVGLGAMPKALALETT